MGFNGKSLILIGSILFIFIISFAYELEGIRIKIKPVMIKEKIYLLMFRFILLGFD